ncbi:hypothetical protein Bca4012_030922 [Brassica carinata]
MDDVTLSQRRSCSSSSDVVAPLLPKSQGDEVAYDEFNGAWFSGAVFNLSTTIIGAGLVRLRRVDLMVLGGLFVYVNYEHKYCSKCGNCAANFWIWKKRKEMKQRKKTTTQINILSEEEAMQPTSVVKNIKVDILVNGDRGGWKGEVELESDRFLIASFTNPNFANAVTSFWLEEEISERMGN